jgi:hypothetical protein
VSWLVRNAWQLARKGIDALPAAPDFGGEEPGEPLRSA